MADRELFMENFYVKDGTAYVVSGSATISSAIAWNETVSYAPLRLPPEPKRGPKSKPQKKQLHSWDRKAMRDKPYK